MFLRDLLSLDDTTAHGGINLPRVYLAVFLPGPCTYVCRDIALVYERCLCERAQMSHVRLRVCVC